MGGCIALVWERQDGTGGAGPGPLRCGWSLGAQGPPSGGTGDGRNRRGQNRTGHLGREVTLSSCKKSNSADLPRRFQRPEPGVPEHLERDRDVGWGPGSALTSFHKWEGLARIARDLVGVIFANNDRPFDSAIGFSQGLYFILPNR